MALYNIILVSCFVCLLSPIECIPYQYTELEKPKYIECINSDDCGFDSCCVLGMSRFSVPSCEKKLRLYDRCRPGSVEPQNTTIAYPDRSLVSLTNVHLIMCPCEEGLRCDELDGKCMADPLGDFNTVDFQLEMTD